MTEQGDTLGRRPVLEYKKERQLEASVSPPQLREKRAVITPRMVAELDRKLNGVIGKIDRLQDQIKKTAKDSIPVHEKAYEVRQALRVLFPGRPDDRIFLDQYIMALEYAMRRAAVPLDKLIQLTIGNLEVDARLINELQWAASDDIDPRELAVIAGQFLLLYVTNRIMQPYSSANMQQVAAPKLYPGTETAPATAQILIGLAALLLQVAENKEEVKKLVRDYVSQNTNMSADQVISEAEAKQQDPVISKYQDSQRPYYWESVGRYSDDYIRNTNEPGYEGWSAYGQLEDQKSDLKQEEKEFDEYGRTKEEAEKTPTRMTKQVYKLILYKVADFNQMVDRTSAILNSKWTADALCCYATFVGAIPTYQLELIRSVLQISASGINLDLGAAIEGVRSRVNSFMAEQLLTPIMHRVDQYFQKYTQDALKLLDRDRWPDKETYDIIITCAPVNHLMEYALNGLDRLKKKLKDLIMRAWNRIELKSQGGRLVIRLLADSKKARMILSLLDQVLAAVKRGNLCAQEGGNMPTPEELEGIVDNLSKGQPAPMDLPVGGDPYETFNAQPFNSELGLPVLTAETTKAEAASGKKPFSMEDCLRRRADPAQILKAARLDARPDGDLRNTYDAQTKRPAP